MQKHTDALLIIKSENGDRAAFGELITRYSNYLFSVVMRIINNEQEAEDVVQDAFIKAWEKLDAFDAKRSKFSTWIYTIATRMAIDVIRSRKKGPELLNEQLEFSSSDVFHDLSNKEIGDLIRQATCKLSHQQKVVFVLRDLEDLEVNEVVEITGYTEKKIKDNLYLARKSIRERLKNVISI